MGVLIKNLPIKNFKLTRIKVVLSFPTFSIIMASVSLIIEKSTFPCLNAIPKITWGSFRGQREKMWGSFRVRDHFRVNFGVGDHFGVGFISGAVQFLALRFWDSGEVLDLSYWDSEECWALRFWDSERVLFFEIRRRIFYIFCFWQLSVVKSLIHCVSGEIWEMRNYILYSFHIRRHSCGNLLDVEYSFGDST